MRLHHFLPALLCLIVLSGCGPKVLTLSSYDGLKTATVTVEVADSPKERDRGLMNRTKLEVDKGMLFAFPEAITQKFWMKNTVIPLEILFFDANGDFVNALQMTPCTADPCELYTSSALAKYALEVIPDFRKANGIGVGWKLDVKQVGKMAKPK